MTLTTSELENKFSNAMKNIARRSDLKTYVEQTPDVYQLLKRAAAKYVTGDDREAALVVGRRLIDHGYAVSIEYIGENTTTVEACLAAALEMKKLIQELVELGITARVSFDLSHIGLSLAPEFAYEQLMELAELSCKANIELFISMEESAKTDAILATYERASARYPHIGITLQAQLNRTEELLNRLQANPARIRLVKGAYQEPEHLAIPRSDALNERYVQLIKHAIDTGNIVSIATHDENIVNEVIQRGWVQKQGVEFEMLYGIRPDLSSRLLRAGCPTRIYLTYGDEWFLYLCHRIAEFPPNMYQAIIDIMNEHSVDPVQKYT